MFFFFSLGDASGDGHARFNLSPVPSLDYDDEDDGTEDHHHHQRDYPNIDQDDDSGEEVDLTGGVPSGTTTVTMFDHDHDITSAPGNKNRDEQGKISEFLKNSKEFYFV